jgi:hypothetical protein
MIARHWRGWTDIGNVDAYETLLKIKGASRTKALNALDHLLSVQSVRQGRMKRTDASIHRSRREMIEAVFAFVNSSRE